MKKLMNCLALGTIATLLGVVAPAARAQSDKENSTFTVTEPIEVGSFTLQPGTYLVKVVMLASNRNTIQVSNVEQTKVFANVLCTPHPIVAGEAVPSSRYIYYTTVAGQPKALRTWFARETTNGQDIIYPKKRAMELAALAKEPVVAMPDTVQEAEYDTVPFSVVTPDQQMKPYTQPRAVVAEARPAKLPRTASPLPLVAALGLLSLGGALTLRVVARQA